jgi:hypothetical protein
MATIIRLTGQDGQPVWVNFDTVMYFEPNGNAGTQINFLLTITDARGEVVPADVLVNESPQQVEEACRAHGI